MNKRVKASVALALSIFVLASAGCIASIPSHGTPAVGYTYGSAAPLRVAVLDETGGDGWSPAVAYAVRDYGGTTPYLAFQPDAAGANIVIHVWRYSDSMPPVIPGYVFQPGVGGFAAVYDDAGMTCNYPPAPVPVGCDGEIATAYIYLNNIILPGADIEARRERLVLHELGHALGLTRHSPDLDVAQLAARYGWPR